MESEFTAIGENEAFQFICNSDVECFNACCHNLYQVLTPYDILRLKNKLALSSGEFLRKYTQQAIGPESGLPVISLRPNPADDMACPFVTPQGCSVYSDRPASCRIYPLARAVTRCRNTGKMLEHYAILKEAHCLGFNCNKSQTVMQWISDQEIAAYNAMNDLLMEVISLKNQHRPGVLDLPLQRIFHMALYDLDNFRLYLKEGNELLPLGLSAHAIGATQLNDDTALLKIGFSWVKSAFRK